MSKPIKTRWEILNSPFVNKKEIKRLLELQQLDADSTFIKAQKYEIAKVGGEDMLTSKSKVSMTSLLAVIPNDFDTLERQIKNAEES